MAGLFSKALKFSIGGAVTAVGYSEFVSASSAKVHPVHNPWPHGPQSMGTMDNQSVRRGFQVYRQVCSACHAMSFFKFRHIINVAHSEAEIKEIASEFEIKCDKPNEDGGYDMRPRGTIDGWPEPYENEILARIANNGAKPPDLSLIVYNRTEEMAAEKGEDYIFNLLTGFMDPPAGVTLSEGMHYNPYFGGNAIGMAPPLYNEIIQYEDGTPATMSQLSADVVQFLCWSTEKHRDERKNMMFKGVLMGTFLLIGLLLNKRNDFAGMKTIFVHNRQLRSSVHKAYHGPPKKS